jgi:triphosphatase
MSLFSDLLADKQTAAIKAELKWLTGELGPARELEVLIKRVVAPTKKREAHWPGLSSLSQEVAQKRDLALERAQNAVRSLGVVPDSGHWIMEENPKATIALVRAFLDKGQ